MNNNINRSKSSSNQSSFNNKGFLIEKPKAVDADAAEMNGNICILMKKASIIKKSQKQTKMTIQQETIELFNQSEIQFKYSNGHLLC